MSVTVAREPPTLRQRVQTPTLDATPDETQEAWDLRLPPTSSTALILICNILQQTSFFIAISSSNLYAGHLGGDATFSGVVLGIPTAIACVVLLPAIKYDGGTYTRPLSLTCGFAVVGHVLYGLAYKANWLYLLLIGRIVIGFSFIGFMYTKRYCTDPIFVGARRRTTLATYLILGQGIGMSVGPFLGGLLYKVGFGNPVFNGYTAPAWLMAVVWVIFWACFAVWFKEPTNINSSSQRNTPADGVPLVQRDLQVVTISVNSPPPAPAVAEPMQPMTWAEWSVSFTMCWLAMTCFFILGAWEASLPVYGAPGAGPFRWSPFAAGNFIALGGIASFPFLAMNIYLAPRMQDRKILAMGSGLGATGLVVFAILLGVGKRSPHDPVSYGSLFICWWAVALGFNMASTVCVSLLSKQLPSERNRWAGLVVQLSIWSGRTAGTVLGGSGVKVGMLATVGIQIALVSLGVVCYLGLWRKLKTKQG